MSSSLLTCFHRHTITSVMLLKYKSDCVRFLPKLLMTFQYLPDRASTPHRKLVPREASSPTSVPHIQGSRLCKSSPLGWWSSFSALCLYGCSAIFLERQQFSFASLVNSSLKTQMTCLLSQQAFSDFPRKSHTCQLQILTILHLNDEASFPSVECGLDKATRP